MRCIKKTFAGIVIIAICASNLAACSRKPNPVATYYPTDQELTCKSLQSAMTEVEDNIDKLIPQTKKTGKNIAIGAASILIFPPALFLLDFGDAEKVEIAAYRSRYNHLARLYEDKQCPVNETKIVEKPAFEEPTQKNA